MSNYTLSSLTPRFYNKDISTKIKVRFGFKPHPWQVSVITNIIYDKKDVFVIASINIGKSLNYLSISKVTGGIVLIIFPTIALMEDQT